MSKSLSSLSVSFSRTDSGLCIYHLFVWLNFNFLHNSQWITMPTQSCLVLYSFCVNLLHSLIMWLMVSSLSLHNLHLLFWCVLSILALIWLVLLALFVLLSEEIQFLSKGFLFLATSTYSPVKCHLFVAYYYYYYYYYFIPCEFFPPTLAGGLSTEVCETARQRYFWPLLSIPA